MKLILSSAGFTTEEIIAKCEELAGKPRQSINVVVINEAYAVEHENNLDWVLDDLNKVRDNFGGNLELVNLLALSPEIVKQRIGLCDVIFVVGGNADYLMSVFNKTGFSEYLPELLKTKVYVGSSAGSMVVGNRTSDEYRKLAYPDNDEYNDINGLEGLVDIAIVPHIDSPYFPGRRELIEKIRDGYVGTLYAIPDDCAIIVDGDAVYTIGGLPLIINPKTDLIKL